VYVLGNSLNSLQSISKGTFNTGKGERFKSLSTCKSGRGARVKSLPPHVKVVSYHYVVKMVVKVSLRRINAVLGFVVPHGSIKRQILI
jgi:hypothetical protein